MNTTPSKPLRNLPDEIWSDIFRLLNGGYNEHNRQTFKSLASVNRLLRHIALPILFRTLELLVPYTGDQETNVVVKQIIQRVRDINVAPHILNAVRQLTLVNWYIHPDEDEDEMSDSESDAASVDELSRRFGYVLGNKFWEYQPGGYSEIISLVSHLPRLEHLACKDCIFAPESLSLLFGIPNLRSLYLHGHTDAMHNKPVNFQVVVANPSLRALQYTHAYWSDEASAAEFFIPLLSQLDTSSFSLHILDRILAHPDSPIALPKLQRLSTFNYTIVDQDNHDDLIHFRNFLGLTPNLRELRVVSDILLDTPFTIPNTVIPHLKTLIAPSYIANGIVPGRALLEKLHVLIFDKVTFRESYNVLSRDVKHIICYCRLHDLGDLDYLAKLFPEASTVEIQVRGAIEPEGTYNAVLSILPEFRRLKQCMVTRTGKSPLKYGVQPSYCPVGRADDSKYRSHSTLEEVQILSSYRWIWCPTDGWYCVRSRSGTDGLYLLRIFE